MAPGCEPLVLCTVFDLVLMLSSVHVVDAAWTFVNEGGDDDDLNSSDGRVV